MKRSRNTPEQTTFLQRFRRHEACKLRVYSVRVHSVRCQIAEQCRLCRPPGIVGAVLQQRRLAVLPDHAEVGSRQAAVGVDG